MLPQFYKGKEITMKKDNPMKIVELKCSICEEKIDEQVIKNTKQVYWTEGHNAEPVNSGRCCSKCNAEVVIPKRRFNIWQSSHLIKEK